MSQVVAVTEPGKSLAVAGGVNPFVAYGESVSQQHILGKMLKFAKGEYLAGEHSELVPVGTKLVVNLDWLAIGWVRWWGGKPTEHRMVRVVDNEGPPKRSELGDLDQTVWEKDNTGELRDPWTFTNYVPMATEDSELFTFATSSRGGITSVGKLSTLYGRNSAKHRDEFPVVELGVGTYLHANKAYGRIKFPEFTIVGWTSKSTFDRALSAAGLTDAYGVEPDDTQPIKADDGESIPF